jgi:predicted glutamine amidotransferase
MCRLLLAAARSTKRAQKLILELLKAFLESTKYDPYLETLTDGASSCHCDGYGYVLALKKGGSWRIIYERFDAYPSRDASDANLKEFSQAVRSVESILKTTTWSSVVLLLHSRKASRGEPRGTIMAHPYYGETITRPSGLVGLYLAHNGSVYKDRIAPIAGVTPDSCTDSCVLHRALLRRLAEGETVRNSIDEFVSHIKSALNLGIILHRSEGRPTLSAIAAIAWSRRIFEEKDRRRYYRFYILQDKSVQAVFSSTLTLYLDNLHSVGLEEWEPSEQYKLDIKTLTT